MDKNEIVRRYKRLKMLYLLPVPLFLIFLIAFVIYGLLYRSNVYCIYIMWDDIMLAIIIFPFLYFMILPFLGLFIGFLIFILEKNVV